MHIWYLTASDGGGDGLRKRNRRRKGWVRTKHFDASIEHEPRLWARKNELRKIVITGKCDVKQHVEEISPRSRQVTSYETSSRFVFTWYGVWSAVAAAAAVGGNASAKIMNTSNAFCETFFFFARANLCGSARNHLLHWIASGKRHRCAEENEYEYLAYSGRRARSFICGPWQCFCVGNSPFFRTQIRNAK